MPPAGGKGRAAALAVCAGLAIIAWTIAGLRAQTTASSPLGLDRYVPTPVDNPMTAEKVALGRLLFSDPRLSRDGTVACVTCHAPERGFTDDEPVAIGVDGRRGTRNAPTLVNRAWGTHQFWDGRAASIEAQILATVQSRAEQDLPLPELEERVAAVEAYRERFTNTFADGVTATNIARALAAYVRTIRSGDSPFDRYQFGDRAALSEQQAQGATLFFGRANCWRCHAGPTLSDELFHNTGVAWRPAGGFTSSAPLAEPRDAGRFIVTDKPADLGAFKTPTLREVARTAPYMHDGSLATLEDVVDFYSDGGQPNPHLDRRIQRLGLTADEKAALVAFLRALSGTITDQGR